MPKVVGVKFRKTPKIYYFGAGENEYKKGCGVIVETARGLEYGEVALLPSDVPDESIVGELKPIIRIATEKDKEQQLRMESKCPEAVKEAAKIVEAKKLPMKMIAARYTFDGYKLILYFTAESRVDFRELVRDLVAFFHVRIELRQVGTRDECKLIGGIGPCGRPCCCNEYNLEHSHVNIKMAKNQGIALNPGKINGLCGNLMCCLGYENDYYAEVNKRIPKIGGEVTLLSGVKGTLSEVYYLKNTVKIKLPAKDGEENEFIEASIDDIVPKAKSGDKEEKKEEEV